MGLCAELQLRSVKLHSQSSSCRGSAVANDRGIPVTRAVCAWSVTSLQRADSIAALASAPMSPHERAC
jgi:hypothetical protein